MLWLRVAGDVILQESVTFAKAMSTTVMIMRLNAFNGFTGEQLLGEYTFNHTHLLSGTDR